MENKDWGKVLLGIGAVVLIGKAVSSLFGKDEEDKSDKKLFVSFAFEDAKYRDFLVAQARNERSPFSFIDMSIKERMPDNEWKRRCRAKIKECDGVIALLSNNTYHAGGARWEMTCAKEENIPIVGMHVKKNDKYSVPPELSRRNVMEWSWENIKEFIQSL